METRSQHDDLPGHLLATLLARASTVILFCAHDVDDDTLIDEYQIAVYFLDGTRRDVSRDDLVEALQASIDGEPMKTCPDCGISKPLSSFPRERRKDGTTAGRRHSYCKICHRRRVAAQYLKQKKRGDV